MVRIGMGPSKKSPSYDQVDLTEGDDDDHEEDKKKNNSMMDKTIDEGSLGPIQETSQETEEVNGGTPKHKQELMSLVKDVEESKNQSKVVDYGDDSDDDGSSDDDNSDNTELVNNLHRARAYQHGSPDSNSTPRRKSIGPPASMFQRQGSSSSTSNNGGSTSSTGRRRFPSYKRLLMKKRRNRNQTKQQSTQKRRGADKKGHHQALPTDEESANNYGYEDDEEPLYERNTTIAPNLIRKINGSNRASIDPSQFPLEQCTDAEYGEAFNYSTNNPMSRDYDPGDLQKMDPIPEQPQSGECRRKIIFIAKCTCFLTIWIVLIVLIATTDYGYSDVVVEPPPMDLENMCDIESISTPFGHRECENACKEAKCCMSSGKHSCFLKNEEMCGRYAPCATLHPDVDGDGASDTNEDYVPPAPHNIGSICSDASIITSSGFVECQSACNYGKCCFTPLFADMMVKGCYQTHKNVCNHYAPCLALPGAEGVHGSPIDLVNEKCAPDNIKYSEGREDCENACQSRSCCFASSRKSNCLADNLVYCHEFNACKILTDNPSTSSTTDLVVTQGGDTFDKQKCHKFTDLTADEFDKCGEICAPATCCFYDDMTCLGINCSEYEFCDIVDVWKGPGPSAVANVSENVESEADSDHNYPADSLCSIDNLVEAGGMKQCEAFCSNYMCCFDGSCTTKATCASHQACGILVDNDVFNINDESRTFDIEKLCSMNALATTGGRRTCSMLCQPYECCASGECSDNSPCPAYAACDNLFLEVGPQTDDGDFVTESNGDDSPPTNLATLCSLDAIQSQVMNSEAKCINFCKKAECCRDKTCIDRVGFCSSYRPCYSVWQVDDKNHNTAWSGNGGPSTISGNTVVNNNNIGITKPANDSSETNDTTDGGDTNDTTDGGDANDSSSNGGKHPYFADLGQHKNEYDHGNPPLAIPNLGQLGNSNEDGGQSNGNASDVVEGGNSEPTDGDNDTSSSSSSGGKPFDVVGSSAGTPNPSQNIDVVHPVGGSSSSGFSGTVNGGNDNKDDSSVSTADFEVLCAKDRINSDEGMTACKKACNPWSCCWATDEVISCRSSFDCVIAIKYCPVSINLP